jgi:hypothetical protein
MFTLNQFLCVALFKSSFDAELFFILFLVLVFEITTDFLSSHF